MTTALAELGMDTWEAGRAYGPAGRVALSPPDALWAALKRLVAQNPAGTRFDRGRLAGQIEATADALAVVLLGHDMTYGNAHEILTRAARDEVAAELATTGKATP